MIVPIPSGVSVGVPARSAGDSVPPGRRGVRDAGCAYRKMHDSSIAVVSAVFLIVLPNGIQIYHFYFVAVHEMVKFACCEIM